MRRSQQDRSRGTKAALTAAARALFATRGYDAVPADEIVRAAGLTRGALYHHYTDKKALFRDVVVGLEAEITTEIRTAMTTAPDLPTGIAAALSAFLDTCTRPEVRQISLLDAPRVLGWSDWRSIEAEFGLALLTEALTLAIDAGLIRPQPITVLSHLILSALTEAALLITDADDPTRTRAEAEQALGAWIAGLVA